MDKKLSVILPVYNQEKYLKESINSILNQSYKNFELIIINDGSTDGSEKIIFEFKDPRIIYFKQDNLGLTKTLNIAINKAKGKFIARMDADDIAGKTRFEKQINYFDKHPDFKICGTWAKLIDEEGNIINYKKTKNTDHDIKKNIIKKNEFVHPSVMFDKNMFVELGGYNNEFKIAQDYDFFIRACKKYKVYNIPEFLIKQRINKESISISKMRKSLKSALKIRWKAIMEYDYPKYYLIFLIYPALSYLIPLKVKFFILKKLNKI